MRNALKIIGGAITFLLLVDFLGFSFWFLSGQLPTDNVYVGTITAHILRAILS